MKKLDSILPYLAAVVILLCAFGLGAGFFINGTRKPLLEWDAIAVSRATSTEAIVFAETRRRASDQCTNGVQADLRDGEALTRLPAPTRSVSGKLSTYEVELPGLSPGSYQIQMREVFTCSSGPKVYNAPWQSFAIFQ